MVNRLLVALSIAGLPLAATAAASPKPGNPLAAGGEQARKYMDDFARCLASKETAKAAAALALPYASDKQQNAASDLAMRDTDCLGALDVQGDLELTFAAPPLASGMAEYFILNPDKLADARRRDPKAFAFVEPTGIEQFGECVVSQNPAAVEALVKSDVGSTTESTSTDSLAPQLGQCIAPGKTFALDRAALRQLLAVSLYRHVAMPAPAASARH
jgi:hypothetical protein